MHTLSFSARSVDEVLLEEIVKLHGFPEMMVSDRDKVFVSQLWRELFSFQGTALHKSTVYVIHSPTGKLKLLTCVWNHN